MHSCIFIIIIMTYCYFFFFFIWLLLLLTAVGFIPNDAFQNDACTLTEKKKKKKIEWMNTLLKGNEIKRKTTYGLTGTEMVRFSCQTNRDCFDTGIYFGWRRLLNKTNKRKVKKWCFFIYRSNFINKKAEQINKEMKVTTVEFLRQKSVI